MGRAKSSSVIGKGLEQRNRSGLIEMVPGTVGTVRNPGRWKERDGGLRHSIQRRNLGAFQDIRNKPLQLPSHSSSPGSSPKLPTSLSLSSSISQPDYSIAMSLHCLIPGHGSHPTVLSYPTNLSYPLSQLSFMSTALLFSPGCTYWPPWPLQ